MRSVTAVGLTAAVLGLAGCGSDGDAGGAIAYCHQFVEQQLRAPSSADFPRVGEHQVTDVGEQRWRVSSYVDAENSFGASLRTAWTCDISYDEAAGVWTLESLSGL
jgi:hypothetical protein